MNAAPGPEIARLAELARAEGRLGIDTEFMPEGRYRPLLCLVQIAVAGEISVLDPLDATPDLDPRPLAEVFADPAVEVVLHAGRQDVAILRRQWGATFANVFDTQIAAGFAGFSAQAGYTGLLHDVMRIRLAKSASFTRWDARPLTAEQVRYAREDVEHLLALADELQSRLVERGRLDWAREECRRDRRGDRRARPRGGLAPAAARLAGWGRASARSRASSPPGASASRPAEDRPVGAVVRDPTVSRAGQAPAGHAPRAGADPRHRRPRSCAGAPTTSWPRSPAAGEAPPIRLDEGERLATEPQDGPAIALAEALVRARAQEAGLAYELIAARADLAPIVVAARRGGTEPDVRTLRGWRRELVGEELLELLAGRRALTMDGGRVAVSEPSPRMRTIEQLARRGRAARRRRRRSAAGR